MIFENEKEIKQVKAFLSIVKNSSWPVMKGEEVLILSNELEKFYQTFLVAEKAFLEKKNIKIEEVKSAVQEQKEDEKTNEKVKNKRVK